MRAEVSDGRGVYDSGKRRRNNLFPRAAHQLSNAGTEFIARIRHASGSGWILEQRAQQLSPHRWRFAFLNFDSGQIEKIFDIPAQGRGGWMRDEKTIMYIAKRDEAENVWSTSVDRGPAKQLTKFSTLQIFNGSPSRDGKLLALARGTSTADVILIKDFR